MARLIVTATQGAFRQTFGTAAEPNAAVAALTTAVAAAAALAPSATAFEAALATLVADGITPTQAHVTAANTAYTTYKTAQLTYVAAVAALSTTAAAGAVSADVTLLVNTTNVTKKNQLLTAVRALLSLLADGTNSFA